VHRRWWCSLEVTSWVYRVAASLLASSAFLLLVASLV
jgi:hypothetical protein